MKKILLIGTGGTIASVKSDKGLTPGISPEDMASKFASRFNCEVDSKVCLNLDSTNIYPNHWIEIATIIHNNYDKYDGFVITHGTDTMAYTAAALHSMLIHLGKPVVLTGSQIPLSLMNSDGEKNLIDTVHYASEGMAGVYIVFNSRVIKGTRAVKLRTRSNHAFESINYPYVAYIENSVITYYTRPDEPKGDQKPVLETNLCPDVFVLKLYPGINKEIFQFIADHYKGVIIECFGSGGIPFYEVNLADEIRELIRLGVVVVLTTQCLEEGIDIDLYEVGRKIDKDKVVISNDMNTEALVPKLMIALGKFKTMHEVIHQINLEIVKESIEYQF
ncbi:asparaginase [Alteribacillus bidgolensis]|uniref:asparaginase n=1 Tax=Alteribacillus bidgolensis TaxID=930129 RepID=A0A1G8FTM6_9BACI|nr:asparaginase [Alteribacillus bidgolensis]SDH85447.1 L-asparaginase [Alteribacillus bidgolensis]